MNITAKMANDLDKIVPGVDALILAYRAGYRRGTSDCRQALIGAVLGMVATGIIAGKMSKKAAKEEIEESES